MYLLQKQVLKIYFLHFPKHSKKNMNRICRKSANENTIMHAIGALSTGILFKELKMEKQRKLSHDNYSLDPNVFFDFLL